MEGSEGMRSIVKSVRDRSVTVFLRMYADWARG